MNFRFLSANSAGIRESNTFCTQAPYKIILFKKKKKNSPSKYKLPSSETYHIKQKEEPEMELWSYYLDRIVRTNIVLIHSLQPTNIIMGVSHQVNIDLIFHYTLWSVINHVLGFHHKQWTTQQQQQQNHHQHFHHLHFQRSKAWRNSS